ncbi:hypothetical protein E4U11_003790 [Claviceps purpurea]|nr:hypothetical protein E4U11_003790 [Claviceps purpurea]
MAISSRSTRTVMSRHASAYSTCLNNIKRGDGSRRGLAEQRSIEATSQERQQEAGPASSRGRGAAALRWKTLQQARAE